MNKIISIKLPILATLVMAMALTLSCSSDSDDNGGGTSSPSGGSSSSGVGNSSSGGENSISSNEQSSSSGIPFCSQDPLNPGCVIPEDPYKSSSSSSVQSSSSGFPLCKPAMVGTGTEYVSDCAIPPPRFIDDRDGKYYFLVEIGTQTWMAQNLNYETGDSKCYGGNPDNCQIYGRLYDWATAMKLSTTCNNSSCADKVQPKHQGICPNGWHLPSKADWEALMTAVGGVATAGKYLKANHGWDYDGNGEDKYGFWALPGGFGFAMGDFANVGQDGVWWSASEYNDFNAYRLYLYDYDEGAKLSYFAKENLYSVRCIKD